MDVFSIISLIIYFPISFGVFPAVLKNGMYSALAFDANYKELYKKLLIAVLGTIIVSEIVYVLVFLIPNLN